MDGAAFRLECSSSGERSIYFVSATLPVVRKVFLRLEAVS